MLDHRPRAHELNGADLDTYQLSVTAGDEYRPSSGKKQSVGSYTEGMLDKVQNTLCGSMPSLFMREINVVRLTSMRAAAPLGPATRPFVTLRMRIISSRSFASRVPAIGYCFPLC